MISRTKIKQIPGAIKIYDWSVFTKRKLFSIARVWLYFKDYFFFKRIASDKKRFKISWSYRTAITFENTIFTDFDRHYVYHTAWAARCLNQTQTSLHIDISSSLYFSALCSAFTKIQFYDFRPPKLQLSGLSCGAADLTNLHFNSNSINSLSCMHTVEHIGLGRYGDVIDPEGDLKAISELQRVLAVGGNLLFVVPIAAEPRIEFNAHRIYSAEQIKTYFRQLELKEFALIADSNDEAGLIYNPSEQVLQKQKYACGCFWFQKSKS